MAVSESPIRPGAMATDAEGSPVIRFRQLGVLTLVVLGLLEAAAVVVAVVLGEFLLGLVMLAVLGPLAVVFHALSIEVGVDHVRCAFGPGWIHRTIPVERIRGVRAVRTGPMQGWGIRLIRGGWLWNVSGCDAVELRLEGGRVFRMGTDRPAEVVEAIEAVLHPGEPSAPRT